MPDAPSVDTLPSTRSQPAREKRLSGLVESLASGDILGQTIPWGRGRRWYGCTWISSPLNVKSKPAPKSGKKGGKGGKKGGGSGASSLIYYADGGCIAGAGPCAFVHTIRVDDEIVWEQSDGLAITGSYVTVDTDRGQARIYKGSNTQPVDSALPDHPAYHGQILLVWVQLQLGQERTSFPSVQVELTCGTSNAGKYSPLTVCRELHTDARWGLGAAADSFPNDAEIVGATQVVAPLIDKASRASEVYERLLSLAMCRARWAGNQLQVTRRFASPDWTTVPQVTDAVWLERPDEEPDSPDEATTELRVRWSNNAAPDDQESVVSWREQDAPFGGKQLDIEARDIITEADAIALALARGHEAAVSHVQGRVTVRKSIGYQIAVDDPFRLRDADGNWINAWCTSRRIAADADEVQLEWEIDKTLSIHDSATPGSYSPPPTTTYDPVDPIAVMLFELPRPLNDRTGIGVLAARAHAMIGGFGIYISQDAGANYELATMASTFAVFGHLGSAISTSTTSLSVAGVTLDADHPQSVSSAQASGDTLLCVLGQAPNHEIVSVRTVALGSNGTLNLSGCLRGRFGTAPRPHNASTQAFIIYRADLPTAVGPIVEPSPLVNTALDPIGGRSYLVKLPQRVLASHQDLDDIDPIEVRIVGDYRRPLPPQSVSPANVKWTPGTDLTFTVSVSLWRDEGYAASDFYELSGVRIVPVVVSSSGARHVLSARSQGESSVAIKGSEITSALGSSPGTFSIEFFCYFEGRHSRVGTSVSVEQAEVV